MGLFFGSFFAGLFTLIAVLFVSFYIYAKYIYQHWTRNNITQLTPTFPFGNTKNVFLLRESVGIGIEKIYKELKRRNVPFGGYYLGLNPEIMVVDPDIIKQVMVKDFQHFTDHGTLTHVENDPLNAHLFHLEGDEWKNLRAKLTPTFTSGKMKMMFNTLLACSKELDDSVGTYVSNREAIDIKDILARFTTDVIGSCAFGIDCNCLKTGQNDFRKYGQLIFEPEGIDRIRPVIAFLLPRIHKYFKFNLFNEDLNNFFVRIVTETVKYREDNNVTRNDFLQLLLQMKNKEQIPNQVHEILKNGNNERITLKQIIAQCFVFYAAGFETSSTTMTFCLYELVKNPDIQEKLRSEVIDVLRKHDNQLSYEAIMEMKYMDKVINETLRKYPPLGFLNRQCTKDYKLPKSNYTIRKGDFLKISVSGIQNDPEYYPNPDVFDPERFSPEEQSRRHPFTYMPFGEGPRICIGLRFGLMQAKVGLAILLKNYRFTLNKKTVEPFKIDPNGIILSILGGIWLNVYSL